jgi:hypothetical protein
MAQKACEMGATLTDLAGLFDVDVDTINRWSLRYPEFCHNLKVGKDTADERVLHSLYQRAVGYTYVTEKAVFDPVSQTAHKVKIKVQMPADVGALKFWLSNRRRDDWSDRRVVTGPNGGPIPVLHIDATLLRQLNLTPDELGVVEKVLTALGTMSPMIEGRVVNGDPAEYEKTLS